MPRAASPASPPPGYHKRHNGHASSPQSITGFPETRSPSPGPAMFAPRDCCKHNAIRSIVAHVRSKVRPGAREAQGLLPTIEGLCREMNDYFHGAVSFIGAGSTKLKQLKPRGVITATGNVLEYLKCYRTQRHVVFANPTPGASAMMNMVASMLKSQHCPKINDKDVRLIIHFAERILRNKPLFMSRTSKQGAKYIYQQLQSLIDSIARLQDIHGKWQAEMLVAEHMFEAWIRATRQGGCIEPVARKPEHSISDTAAAATL
jgi:hypothetical protein